MKIKDCIAVNILNICRSSIQVSKRKQQNTTIKEAKCNSKPPSKGVSNGLLMLITT